MPKVNPAAPAVAQNNQVAPQRKAERVITENGGVAKISGRVGAIVDGVRNIPLKVKVTIEGKPTGCEGKLVVDASGQFTYTMMVPANAPKARFTIVVSQINPHNNAIEKSDAYPITKAG